MDISLAPYNPQTDAILDSTQQHLNEEDLEWERKRGTKEYDEWMIKQKQKVVLPTDGGAQNGTQSGPGNNVLAASSGRII